MSQQPRSRVDFLGNHAATGPNQDYTKNLFIFIGRSPWDQGKDTLMCDSLQLPARSLLPELPTELYGAILDHVEPDFLKSTALALIKALPRSPVPSDHLLRYVELKTPQQVVGLYKRLAFGADKGREPGLVREFALEGFGADADVLVSLIELLPKLDKLHINIGTTFAPSHLDDMFQVPKSSIEQLSLRFRPYVQRATYYQFLKGAYFDSTLEQLSRWPASPKFRRLSIVQDPVPANTSSADGVALGPSMSFAQPIVFFSIDPFSKLATSPLARGVTHLRFRIPSRPVVHQLCVPGSFPSLQFLDLSTTLVNVEHSLPTILSKFSNLRHLVIDASGICGHGKDREGWKELGKLCALGGIKKSRDRERTVKAWLDKHGTTQLGAVERTPERAGSVAQATLATGSIPLDAFQMGNRRPRRPRPISKPTISLRDRTPAVSQTAPARIPFEPAGLPQPSSLLQHKVRILPPPSRLLTLCAAGSPKYPQATPETHAAWVKEFEAGWKEGIERLKETWKRARTFGEVASIRVMRFDLDHVGDSSSGEDEGLEGLVDDTTLEDMLHNGWENPPILCFGCDDGLGASDCGGHDPITVGHTEGCGHGIGWTVFGKRIRTHAQ